MMKNI